MTTTRRTRTPLIALVVAVTALLGACGGTDVYAETTLPSPTPTAAATTAAPTAAATPAVCADPLASYAPQGPLPAPDALPAGSTMAEIRARGRLVVGVSADSLLLGARNPISGQIEGFDIDMARLVAQAILGDPDAIELKVITAAQRIPSLQDGTVDLVARNMTITCDRWTQIAFSAEYYESGQKVLVPLASTATSLDDLAGQRVCAPAGTSSLANLADHPDVVAVAATTHTDCLVQFQQGQVDAITGDDTVLAGLAAQDPYAKVVGEAFTQEPYGLGMNSDDVDLVRFVNAVLEQAKADGTWTASYDRWLADALGAAPAPPVAVYGR
ncbi:glutamate ABC transporter substrate-binding protein [Cellulomonas soli]|uniref:ABC transporter substrate-binding protein n=1 Tax=Cellulomonas soli TaxID=931535 RepID=A0A512PE26_9CELL|nr:glutamate ABC transporter substrate-binding protein [Cellulomonas soli]NYI59051.1 polar amino acid transport system substrate-binding protein [Cellulomonas soli]GEP69457.1 ABC transporter substrate-binding protein [Cellulomonas soli]